MIGRRSALSMGVGLWLSGCHPLPAGVAPATALRQTWMIGVERVRDDPGLQLPYTNRMIEDLAAMPNVQVVFVGDPRNSAPFAAWTGGKLLVSPWLHGEGTCMNITYTIFDSGQRQRPFGLVVPALPAGQEPDSACVDRAATEFYRALVVQGL
jgi:hypothetical protein